MTEQKTLMEHLKDNTRTMHDSAESSEFQGHLANGRLPQEAYASYLEQLYLVHGFLEQEITKHSNSGAFFAGVVSDDQLQVPFLEKDLKHFGRDLSKIKPVPATTAIINEMKELSKDCPVALLGMHYVLLGSKHGGKFIAKSCHDKYHLNDAGAVYFDPYGQTFMPLWKEFKEAMNKLQISEADLQKTSDSAGKMFSAVGNIGAELMPLARA